MNAWIRSPIGLDQENGSRLSNSLSFMAVASTSIVNSPDRTGDFKEAHLDVY